MTEGVSLNGKRCLKDNIHNNIMNIKRLFFFRNDKTVKEILLIGLFLGILYIGLFHFTCENVNASPDLNISSEDIQFSNSNPIVGDNITINATIHCINEEVTTNVSFYDGEPVALWHMDEGSGDTIYDITANHNDGTIYGASWVDGKYGKALSFDGTNGYVSVSHDNSLDITSEISVEAWVKGEGAGFSATKRTPSCYGKYGPQMNVVNATIYYVWYESDGSYYQIWTGEMNTNGTGWSATKRTTSSYAKYNPQLQVVGDKIYYVWYEKDNSGIRQIWTAVMNTDGTGWSTTKRTTSSYSKLYPQLQVVEDKIYYVWLEWDGSTYQIWTAVMNTNGTEWSATKRTTSSYVKYDPQLQVVGDKIYYVWYEDDDYYLQIWTGEMNTDGTGWSATKRTTSSYYKFGPRLQVMGDKIYYVWYEYDDDHDYQIWTAVMNTNGTGWIATKRTTSVDNLAPQLQVVGDKIYYVWYSPDWWLLGKYQIWTGEMNTNGTGWIATEWTTSNKNKTKPQLQVNGDMIYYVWQEDDGSYYQIWTAKMTIWNATPRTTSSFMDSYPQLQVVGSKIYYVWEGYSGGFQIWTGEMNTNGTGWSVTKRTTTSYDKFGPRLQVVEDKIYYVWYEFDDDDFYYQIWTGEMNTNGTGWSATKRTTSSIFSKYHPQLQVVEDKIYYVWYEGDDYYQIWTAVMNTDGTGWSATKRTTSSYNKYHPQLQVVSSKIYYVWYEKDNSGKRQIWTAVMNTDGTGWSAIKRTTSSHDKWRPQLQVVGDKIYYVWCNNFIYTAKMNTNGTEWSATTRTTSSCDKWAPQLQVVGDKVYYVWREEDNDDYWQIWSAKMNTNGTEWSTSKWTGSRYNKFGPQLQVVGDKIYYVWRDGSYYKIWTAKMNTNATAWSAIKRTTSSDKSSPRWQVVGSKIYYVWYEEDSSGIYQIWTAVMNTDGTGWSPTKRTTSSYNKFYPQLQVVGDKIYYVWREDDGFYYQIWTAVMNTDGTGWSPTKRTTSSYEKYNPQLQVVGDKIYYVWYERDDDYVQIWTAKMNTDGTGWSATNRTTSSSYKYGPQLQVVGDKIYYVWYEVGSPPQIWTAVMNADGTGWSATKRTTSSYEKYDPQLQVVGDKIYYVWYEKDNSGIRQIWTAVMNTDGTGWSATKRTTSSDHKRSPQLQVVGSKIYYVWNEEDFHSNSQIWTAKIGSNILNKGDFYGLGIMGDSVKGFINAGMDGFKFKGNAISYTSGAVTEATIDTNWNHVAMTYDGLNVRLYVNGNLVDTESFTESVNTNPFKLLIGDDFDGKIDEVAIFNRALTEGEIKFHYENSMLIGTDTITVPADGSKVASIEWNITHASNHTVYVVVDPENEIYESNETNNTANKEITIEIADLNITTDDISFSNPNPTNGSTITINAEVHCSGGDPTVNVSFYDSLFFNDTGLISLWHMDEETGNKIYDETTNVNDGIIHGAIWVNGKYGKALEFDGLDDYVDCGSNASLDISGDLTISCWVYPKSSALSAIIDMAKEGTTSENYGLLISDGNRLYFQYYNGGWQQLNIANFYTLNAWQQVVITFEGDTGTATAYKNGKYIDNMSGMPALLTNTENVLKMGRYQVGSKGWFEGKIDEVAIYNRVLTEEEIKAHYEYPILINNLIGNDTITVPVDGSAIASVDWTITYAGNHTIYVVVDPEDKIYETNESNNTASKNITVEEAPPISFITSLKVGWNLVGIPFDQSIALNDIIVNYLGTNYTWENATSSNNPTGSAIVLRFVYGWNKTNQQYELVDELEPGYGYWMYAYYNCILWANLSEMKSNDFEITDLLEGWNLVGYPVNESINLDNLIIKYDGTDYSWENATTSNNPNGAPIVLRFVYGWNRTNQQYILVSEFEPGYGYWMYAYFNCTLFRQIDGTTTTNKNQILPIDFTWKSKSQKSSTTVQFEATITTPPNKIGKYKSSQYKIISWQWNFANLGSSNEQNPSFTFNNPGTYPITLTVWDEAGNCDSVIYNINIFGTETNQSFTPTEYAQASIYSDSTRDDSQVAQSFIASTSNLESLSLYLSSRYNKPTTAIIKIQSNAKDQYDVDIPSNIVIASSQISFSEISSNPTWIDFDINVNLIFGQKYWIILKDDDLESTSNYILWWQKYSWTGNGETYIDGEKAYSPNNGIDWYSNKLGDRFFKTNVYPFTIEEGSESKEIFTVTHSKKEYESNNTRLDVIIDDEAISTDIVGDKCKDENPQQNNELPSNESEENAINKEIDEENYNGFISLIETSIVIATLLICALAIRKNQDKSKNNKFFNKFKMKKICIPTLLSYNYKKKGLG